MTGIGSPYEQPDTPELILDGQSQTKDCVTKITQYLLTKGWWVSRLSVSDLLHEKRSLTAEMAVRIAKVIGGAPESWLRMQEAVDLWEVVAKFESNPDTAPRALAA